MTDTIAIDEAKTLQEADALVDQLAVLLEKEFEALKAQDLDQFEVLLGEKNHLLSELGRLTGVRQPEDADKLGAHWNEFRARMMACRDMHRRNEILIMRKLDAIKAAIQSGNYPVNPRRIAENFVSLEKIIQG